MGLVDVVTNKRASPEEYRLALGNFISGVTIVTSLDAGQPVGTTVSAFSAVSMDPPLILVCLAQESNTLPHAVKSGIFGVNVLSSAQADLAKHFASSTGKSKFESVDFCAGASGVPLIHGAVVWLECTLNEALLAGDHTILIGHVQSSVVHPDFAPLTYYRGAFVDMAD